MVTAFLSRRYTAVSLKLKLASSARSAGSLKFFPIFAGLFANSSLGAVWRTSQYASFFPQILGDLALLTSDTLSGPRTDILVHEGPEVLPC